MANAASMGPVLPNAHNIPEFSSEEEEREWWASHDTSELPGEDVSLRLARSGDQLPRIVGVRTDQETVDRLKRLAAERGLDYHEMVRTWVHERLQLEDASRR